VVVVRGRAGVVVVVAASTGATGGAAPAAAGPAAGRAGSRPRGPEVEQVVGPARAGVGGHGWGCKHEVRVSLWFSTGRAGGAGGACVCVLFVVALSRWARTQTRRDARCARARVVLLPRRAWGWEVLQPRAAPRPARKGEMERGESAKEGRGEAKSESPDRRPPFFFSLVAAALLSIRSHERGAHTHLRCPILRTPLPSPTA